MGSVVKLQSVKSFRSFKYNMKSITLASIVFTLSFCLNLVAGKNLPYKGSPSAGFKTDLGEVEDTEDNNGERGTNMITRTKRDLNIRGCIDGGILHNGQGAKANIGCIKKGTKVTGDRDGIIIRDGYKTYGN